MRVDGGGSDRGGISAWRLHAATASPDGHGVDRCHTPTGRVSRDWIPHRPHRGYPTGRCSRGEPRCTRSGSTRRPSSRADRSSCSSPVQPSGRPAAGRRRRSNRRPPRRRRPSTTAPLGSCCGRPDAAFRCVEAFIRGLMARRGATGAPSAALLLAKHRPERPRDEAKGRCSASSLWRKCSVGEAERCCRQAGWPRRRWIR